MKIKWYLYKKVKWYIYKKANKLESKNQMMNAELLLKFPTVNTL